MNWGCTICFASRLDNAVADRLREPEASAHYESRILKIHTRAESDSEYHKQE